ncbi:S41 family peptidase [Luteolibacter flavescens]|uniref:Tricorn protease homolog n=1 Tax=Luteolibacter flavescens TaxID=1859460 RepID=A0ABT3FUT7_9BACT|nr:S41 family peptidase [Luteolibacter flavescens]MCW1887341.1 S41 family peptidase [Luteolibacter flavescens]
MPRVFVAFTLIAVAHGAPGFFRMPALHGETVVFTAESDLWKVSVKGGSAQRLTTHPGLESSATISRDGKWLAFTAEYEGPMETFVMPLDGGLPKRLTWHGEGSRPVGWTSDGKVLVTTRAHSTLPNDQLVAIDPATGVESLLPLSQASDGDFDEIGMRLVFTRLPFQGSSTKRYVGGTVQNLWRFDLGSTEAVPLTGDFKGTSKRPMWDKDRLYFLSDRSGTMNLWSMTPDGKDAKALTSHADFDIRHADLHEGRIVYQHAGALRLFTIGDGSDVEIPVTLASDFDQTRDRWVKRPMEYLTRFSVSPDGEKLVLTARGSVFVAPVKAGGRLVEIPRPADVRFREASFLPDGKSLVAQTDQTGEIEMVKLPANGVGAPEMLTGDGTIFRYAPVPSPDGKRLAWQDKNLELWVRDLATKQSVKVSTSPMRGFPDMAWSPDGQWLAFVEPALNTFPRIRLYNTNDGSIIEATSDRVMSSSPAWSADGKWLYFLSDRELKSLVKSPWGPRQPEPFFTESTRIYALALTKDARFPFTPPDELVAEPKEEKKDEKNGDKPATVAAVSIDPDGLATRLYEVPGVSGNLSGLVATPKHLFFNTQAPGNDTKPRLMRLDISHDDAKPKVFAEDTRGWDLSFDGKWLALRKGDAFHVVPSAGECPAKLDKPVALDRWGFSIDPKEEWRQIYRESWRMLRDFFYDPNMHGLDWVAVRQKYEPLVDRVADRADLGEILHEMSGELSALHIYVRFGDLREGPEKIQPSALGARLSRDLASGGWRVDHIFTSDPEYPGMTSPLAKPGVGVKEGDTIMAINGRELKDAEHPQQWLAQKAGQQVLLDVLSPGGLRRNVLVKPLSPEAAADLRYSEWEYTRRLETERLGQGKIGYVHLRNMGPESILEWARDFYPVFDRQGLIIDMRHNRGGNTDSWILGRLLRKAWFHWSPRAGMPYSNMQYAFRGHIAVLCNEWTASDGEAFSEGVRRLGLGKVFGTRTWGGQIWLNAQRWLIDNGMCSAAEIGVYSPEGEWLIEGTGIEPDETVDNLPHATFGGADAQLEAAVKHLQDLIEKDPRPVPQPPARPDKTK